MEIKEGILAEGDELIEVLARGYKQTPSKIVSKLSSNLQKVKWK